MADYANYEGRKESAPSFEAEERVVLNVGGVKFETYRSTLVQQTGNLLSAMFSERNKQMLKADKHGEYFFDRDPSCFNVILNYFRTGKLLVPSNISEELMKEEFAFFQIELSPNVDSEAAVYAWGRGEYGQLGHGSRQGANFPKLVSMPQNVVVVKLSLGTSHSCALCTYGNVYSWGYGGDGRLGHGDEEDVLVPKMIESLQNEHLVDIDCGELHSGATTETGKVFLWGFGKNGRLGLGNNTENRLTPTCVEEGFLGFDIASISCGGLHTACLSSRGEIFTFGLGKDGRLGHGNEDNSHRPQMVQFFGRIKIAQVICGGHHTSALDVEGRIWTWGFDDDGRLGHGTPGHQFIPLVVESLVHKKIVSVACGCWHSAALADDGTVFTWGSCKSGQLGLGDKSPVPVPRVCLQGIGQGRIKEIACGTAHTVALTEGGNVFCWGKTKMGVLGSMPQGTLPHLRWFRLMVRQ
jgi:alpha-tubulin suppressor-like RCC1 family protein